MKTNNELKIKYKGKEIDKYWTMISKVWNRLRKCARKN